MEAEKARAAAEATAERLQREYDGLQSEVKNLKTKLKGRRRHINFVAKCQAVSWLLHTALDFVFSSVFPPAIPTSGVTGVFGLCRAFASCRAVGVAFFGWAHATPHGMGDEPGSHG